MTSFATPETIEELLLECSTHPLLGSGTTGHTYSMAHHEGFEPYVMRMSLEGNIDPYVKTKIVTAHEVLDDLTATSGLTPTSHLPADHNLGQRIVEAGRLNHMRKPQLGIHLRQRGESINVIENALNEKYRRDGDLLAGPRSRLVMRRLIMNAAEETGANPFLPIVRLADAVQAHGFTPQTDHANVLYDVKSKQLGLVDQMSHNQNGMTLERMFGDSATHDLEMLKEANADDVSDAVASSHAEIQTMIARARQENAQLPAISLRIINPTGVQAVHLYDPPSALLAQLNALHGQGNYPLGR